MNWNALNQATGWMPGASVGALAGLGGTWWYWEDKAAPVCDSGASIRTDCVQTVLGEFNNIGTFGAAIVAIGGIVGVVVNLTMSELSPEGS